MVLIGIFFPVQLNKTVVAKAHKLRKEGGKPAAPKKEAPKEAKKAGKK